MWKKNILIIQSKKYFIVLLMLMFLLTSIQVVEAIIVGEASGIPVIGTIVKSPNEVPEDGKLTLTIPVTNKGTPDTIIVTLKDKNGNIIESKSSSSAVPSNGIETFYFDIYPSAVTTKTCYDITIEAQSWSDSDSKIVNYCVTDVTNLVTPTQTSPSFEIILSLIAIFIIVCFKK